MERDFVATHVAQPLLCDEAEVDDLLDGGTKEGGHEEMHGYNYRGPR